MSIIPFVGRSHELDNLSLLLQKKTASLVVIKGRRRIGKSRLVEEFAHGKKFYFFSGLPPASETTSQSQRDEFTRQMGEQMGLHGLKVHDWGDIFTLLAKQTQQGRVIILLDEISWMGSKDPDFLGKLKIAWDLHFQKNSKLILILCGSVSSWIEKNIVSSTGFFGRISLKITLEDLALNECHLLLKQLGFRGAVMEEFMILSVTGGIPWYIQLFNPSLPTTENIKKLCFEPNGSLVDEFKYIFHDLFGKRGEICKRIVDYLAEGPREYSKIASDLNYSSGGPLSEYLDDLTLAGFISREYIWSIKSGNASRLSHYRLRDNYLRFYLKYIFTNLDKINRGHFKTMSLSALPGWESLMGFQFENLVLNNRELIHQALKIKPDEIIYDNPFFQRKTTIQKGCQIDYLIQTRYGTLYCCEVKFSKNKIGSDVIDSVQEKINRLKYPKGFSCRPILIHVNGVQEDVLESGFFANVIDFSQLLTN